MRQLPATVVAVSPARPTASTASDRLRSECGFTLSELLLVAVFVIGLMVIAVTSAQGIESTNRRSNCQTELRNLKMAVGEYYAERQVYPGSVADVVSAGKAEMSEVDDWVIEPGAGDAPPDYRPVFGRC